VTLHSLAQKENINQLMLTTFVTDFTTGRSCRNFIGYLRIS